MYESSVSFTRTGAARSLALDLMEAARPLVGPGWFDRCCAPLFPPGLVVRAGERCEPRPAAAGASAGLTPDRAMPVNATQVGDNLRADAAADLTSTSGIPLSTEPGEIQ